MRSESLESGTLLRSRYQIREQIGQGGMGNIYLAEDTRLKGRICAVKEVIYEENLPPAVLREAREQFQREASVLARLDHPNLPKVSDFFSIEDNDYLIMDYVPGKDLRTILLESQQKNELLSEHLVLDWISQLADALIYLHSQDPSIVHRDIKPSNLKVTPDGYIKLVDFGLVKILNPGEDTITIIQGQGTLLYTPLEQYGGSDSHTDARSDIYALGATMYHILTGKPPLDARQRFINPQLQLQPREYNPKITPRTEKAILWALEIHPDQRPKSVEEFTKYLFGTKDLPMRPTLRSTHVTTWDLLWSPPQSILLYLAAALLMISFIVTLSS